MPEQYSKEAQARTSVLGSSDTTSVDPEVWPAAHTISDTGEGDSLSVGDTGSPLNDWPEGSKNTNHRALIGGTQIWYRLMWPTSGYRF